MERAYDGHVVREFQVEPEELPGQSRPARPVKLVESDGSERPVQALRLGHGHRLAVERDRSQFEFYGGSFYQASRALSERLPFLGLTALQYGVWHTLLGVQIRGGIIAMTQAQLAARLQTDTKSIRRALQIFEEWGFIYRPRKGQIRLNPLIAFYGSSGQQAEALADLPDDVPPITLPTGSPRPRSRKAKTGPKGVQ